jgi:MFS family permease
MRKNSRKEKNELKKRENAAKLSIKEGSFTMLMEGFGTRYISPYALVIGATNFQIGLLSSVPGLLGNFFQLPFLYLMKRYSRKKIVIKSVMIQALMWLPIISIGFLYFFNYIGAILASNLLIIAYTLMIIAGTLGGPFWNSWMKDLVQERCGEYFGKRNKILNMILVMGMLFSGVILNYFGKEEAFKGFLIIFLIAFLGRLIAGFLLTRQYEPKFKYEEGSYFSFLQFTEKMFFNNFGRFVILVSLMSFATAVAGPFFAVYMLKDLNLPYIGYGLVSVSSIFSMIIFMPVWGRFADKYGNIKVLKITGFLIPFIPIVWIFSILIPSGNLYLLIFYLMLTEVYSGFSWAGFNLSAANFIYDAVSRQRMAICVAYFNLLNAFGVFIGALIGGVLIKTEFIFGVRSILLLFILSSFFRFLVIILMGSLVKEVRTVPKFNLPKHLTEKIKFEIQKVNVLKYIGFHAIGRETHNHS